MSDDFIPFSQSTPKQNKWQKSFKSEASSSFQNSGQYSRNSNWNNSSFGKLKTIRKVQAEFPGSPYLHTLPKFINNSSTPVLESRAESDRSNNSQRRPVEDINAYLHPAMLRDPWAHLYNK